MSKGDRYSLCCFMLMGFALQLSPGGELLAAERFTVPAVTGNSAVDARKAVEDAGLTAKFRVGKTALSPRDSFKIYSVEPAVGKRLKKGDAVTLTLYGKHVAEDNAGVVRVPDVMGRPAGEAKRKLVAAGLSPKFHLGQPAPTAARALHVYESKPAAATRVARGSDVNVTIFSNASTEPSPEASSTPVQPRAWLGVYVLPLTPGELAALRIAKPTGVVVAGVCPGSPAATAGLRTGDVIVSVDEKPVRSLDEVAYWVGSKPGGAKADLAYQRGGIRKSTEISGMDIPPDLEKITLQAAESGQSWAQYEVARQLHVGDNVNQDLPAARRWMQKAAEQGLAVAQAVLGEMLIDGVGGPADGEAGLKWLEKAATLGLVDAQFELGLAYHFGRGATRNQKLAADWLKQAADAGHGGAQYTLGCLYETTDPPDLALALKWLQKAAANGVPEAHAKIRAKNAIDLKQLQAREQSLLREPPENLTARQLDKEFAELRWQIARRLAAQDVKGAIGYARSSLQLDAAHPERWEQLGDLYALSGELTSASSAVTAYDNAVVLEPTRQEAHLKLGGAYLMNRQPAHALKHLEYYLCLAEDSGESAKALNVYVSACAAAGDLARGIAFCAARVKAEAGNQFRIAGAILEHAAGRRESAVLLLSEVESSEDKSSRLHAFAVNLRQSYESNKGPQQ